MAPENTDLTAAFKPPATFIDRFYVMANADRFRIAFGEQVGENTDYSTAVAMSPESARQLGEMLLGFFVAAEAEPGQ